MAKILLTDENNDIYRQANGRLAVGTDLGAITQACEHAAQAQLGEMIFAVDKGVPSFQTVWRGAPNLVQFEAAVRSAISAVNGVVRIRTFSASVSAGVLQYSATIETIYGEVALNGV